MNFSKIFHSLEILASSWLKKERIGDAIVFIECIRKNKWKIPQRSDHSWKTRDFVDKKRKNHEYEGKREFSLFLRISFWRDSKGDFVVEKKHSHVTYCRTRICGETDTNMYVIHSIVRFWWTNALSDWDLFDSLLYRFVRTSYLKTVCG